MNNNPDVPPVALCAFRNESDSGECDSRTHRFEWVKVSGRGNKWSLPCVLSAPSHTQTGCVLVLEAGLVLQECPGK